MNRRRWCVLAGLVIGAVLQGFALHAEQSFVLLSAIAALWWITAAVASGPVPVGRITPAPLLTGIATGLGLAVVFLVGALLVRLIPPLASLTNEVLAHGDRAGVAVTLGLLLLGGLGEEVFFRGAVWSALGSHREYAGTVIYTAVMAVSANLMLTFAALVLGGATAWLRRRSGGIAAPFLAHITWSSAMFLLLPALV